MELEWRRACPVVGRMSAISATKVEGSVHVAEFDFAGWVARARAFTLGLDRLPAAEVRSTTVAASFDESDLRALEGALGAILPASLRAFFNRGASAMDCAYTFKPEGQALDR